MIDFQMLYPYSAEMDRNEFFIQYFNPSALFRYDSNYFHLLYSPSKEEFQLIEDMHWFFSEDNGLGHVKFTWPKDQGLLPETLDYLSEQGYGLEKLELYSIDPAFFKGVTADNIQVTKVTHEQLDTFKTLNYIEDMKTSRYFADEKQGFYDLIFSDPLVTMWLALKDDQTVGSCITIEQSETIEIDDVFTLPEHRGQNVASTLQARVMAEGVKRNKRVILAADAEDSVKDMYIKQGYTCEGFQIGAIRTLEEENE